MVAGNGRNNQYINNRHQGYAIFSYCDGSAKKFRSGTVTKDNSYVYDQFSSSKMYYLENSRKNCSCGASGINFQQPFGGNAGGSDGHCGYRNLADGGNFKSDTW